MSFSTFFLIFSHSIFFSSPLYSLAGNVWSNRSASYLQRIHSHSITRLYDDDYEIGSHLPYAQRLVRYGFRFTMFEQRNDQNERDDGSRWSSTEKYFFHIGVQYVLLTMSVDNTQCARDSSHSMFVPQLNLFFQIPSVSQCDQAAKALQELFFK